MEQNGGKEEKESEKLTSHLSGSFIRRHLLTALWWVGVLCNHMWKSLMKYLSVNKTRATHVWAQLPASLFFLSGSQLLKLGPCVFEQVHVHSVVTYATSNWHFLRHIVVSFLWDRISCTPAVSRLISTLVKRPISMLRMKANEHDIL